ncbi:MAG TPA: 23S rRNA (adenine(2030)-N(6))-methyltransferase RlmJ [Rhizomicrobium sp.]|nr:23S rRNA (adenine(2030)-N(6))-methyltransferase RlmJ [Rhizomicrobium sp.]
MNYRHGYHAGNFADVVKHLALVAILLHLRKKDSAFSVVDSHAGRGAYDLEGAEAGKTGEARGGIARLADMSGEMPQALSTYLSLVKQSTAYPGSPLIAAKLLRPQDRLTAIEKNPAEFAVLEKVLAPYCNGTAEQADGYARVLKLLPPPSRRGLALIDPPFESPEEFSTLAQSVREATRKFATGIFLIWYPIKSQAGADAFTGEVLAGGIAKALAVETRISAPEGKLARAGLLVINPPFGFAAVMEQSARLLAPRLDAMIAQAWLAGAE